MLNINVTEVAISAQGHDATIKPEEFPAETLAYWLVYGIRRAYQDGINSVAKKLRDDGHEVDGAALFADRDKIFREASMGTRDWSGDSAEVREAKSMLRVQVKAGDPKGYKNADPDKRDEMVNAAWDKLPEVQRESYLKAARVEIARKAQVAKERAEAIAALEVPVNV
jgi:hypothetical protein